MEGPPGPAASSAACAGVRLEAFVERTARGYLVKGTVSGRPGRIEVYRAPAPAAFLLNNWQSWGPMERATPATRFPELEAIVRDYSPYLFSPVPGELLRGPVSDYFAAWDGGLAGFLTSRVGHPFFTIEGGDLVGWIDYFDAEFEDPVALEPLIVLTAARPGTSSIATAALVKRANRVRINPLESRRLVQLVPLFRQARLAGRPREPRRGGRRPEGLPLRRLPGRRRLRDRDRRLALGQTGLPGPRRAGPGDHREGFRAGIWAAPFSAAETSRLFAEHPGLDGLGGRPAQTLL